MTSFRLFSDLHMEFADFDIPPLDTDKDDVCVLAGDIGLIDTPSTLARIKQWIPRFKKVIHICGNHEYYGSSILRARPKLRTEIMKDVVGAEHIGINDVVVRVDNVSFICATLWTDYYRGNPLIMQTVRNALNDYRYIRTGNFGEPYLRRINPHDIFNEHCISKNFIFEAIKQEKMIDGQKIVVVTHHAPTTLSIHESYKGDPVNWGYCSDLWNDIADAQPDYWVHGHTHFTFDYTVEKTRVLTNPRGYARKVQAGYGEAPFFVNENAEFNPTLRIEV